MVGVGVSQIRRAVAATAAVIVALGLAPSGGASAAIGASWAWFGCSTSEGLADVAAVPGSIILAGSGLACPPESSGPWVARVTSYSPAGAVQWNTPYQVGAGNYGRRITITSDGSIVQAGFTAGATSTGVLARLTGTGTVAWTTQVGVSGRNELVDVAELPDGSFVTVGRTTGSFDGSPLVGGDSDAVIARVSATGTLLWAKQFGTSGTDAFNAVDVSPAGEVLVAGTSSGAFLGGTPLGGDDVVLVEVNDAGAVQWHQQLGTSGQDKAGDLLALGSDEVVAVGTTDGALPGYDELGVTDGFIARVTSSAVTWARQWGPAGPEAGTALVRTSSDTVWVGGQTPLTSSAIVLEVSLDGAYRRHATFPGYVGVAGLAIDAGGALWTGMSLGGVFQGFAEASNPTAGLSASQASAHRRELVTLTATGSVVDGVIARYDWDLDGDGQYETQGGPIRTASWNTVGTKVVGVRVTTGYGSSATAQTSIEVVPDPAPAVTLALPVRTWTRVPVTATATAAISFGSVAGFAFDLDGDGTFELADSGPSVPVTWTSPGSHVVRVRATSDRGVTAEAEAHIDVLPDPAPAVTLGLPQRALTGVPATATATAEIAFGSVAGFAFDLDGDGTFEVNGAGPSVPVTWTAPGSHVVRVRATSDRGVTAEAEAQVEVYPSPPSGEAGVSINAGTAYTNNKNVELHVSWPAYATEVRISNDGGFAQALTAAVGTPIPWTLDDSVGGRYTKVVYLRFTGPGVDSQVTYSDDIILDTEAPSVTRLEARALGAGTGAGLRQGELRRGGTRIALRSKASDKLTGVETMAVSAKRGSGEARTVPYASRVTVRLSVKAAPKRLFVRAQDGAGNWSRWRTVKVAS